MTQFGMQKQVRAMLYSRLGKLVGQLQVVVGEEGKDLLLGEKHLLAGAIVGQAETDKTIMH